MITTNSIDVRSLSYEEWQKTRNRGIGGSDAASILGLNKWKSPIRVYMEKIGEIEPEKVGEAAYWGTKLEDLLAKEFEERTNKRAFNVNKILIHPEYDWMIANIDRRVVGENAILEIKTTSAYKKEDWEDDDIPQEYIIQVMHYMAVTGADKAYFATLIGGQKFLIKEIERDENLIDALIKHEKMFWENHVLKHTPPDLDGSEDSSNLILNMYPEAKEEGVLDLPNEADELLQNLSTVKTQINDLETIKTEYENKIKQMIGQHAKGFTTHYRVNWPTVESNRFDKKAFKKDHPDLCNQYTKKSISRRFTFKEVK
jgi:putative phage-type endonuclease